MRYRALILAGPGAGGLRHAAGMPQPAAAGGDAASGRTRSSRVVERTDCQLDPVGPRARSMPAGFTDAELARSAGSS